MEGKSLETRKSIYFISRGSNHRLKNPLPNTILKIIKVQSGSHLGDKDIKRFKDEYS